jgi:hypothetical protein
LAAADEHGPPRWTLNSLTEAAQAEGVDVHRSQVRRIRLRAQGVPVKDKDEDVARLSFLGHARINFLGRYAITTSTPAQRLRPLGEVPDLPATAS